MAYKDPNDQKACKKRWKLNNPEKLKMQRKRYRLKHPENNRKAVSRNHARKQAAAFEAQTCALANIATIVNKEV